MLLACCAYVGAAFAQNEFYLRDTTVTECEGILYDSELGKITGHYDHNEDYSFSICIAGADAILLDFTYFHTEATHDEIRFYDGPNTSSPLIAGPYSGRVDIPTITARSGCLTVHFISDANVAEPGWRAVWRTSNLVRPEPPKITLLTDPICPVSELLVSIDRAVHCDSLYAAAVTLVGPKAVGISSVEAVGCMGDSTRQFRIRLASPLDFAGRYRITLRTIVPYCTAPYVLFSPTDFVLTGCPLALRLLVLDPDLLCRGNSTRITAEVTGGIPNTYTYSWSPFSSSTDTVRTGPIFGPVVVTLNVRDASGATATGSVTLVPLEDPIIAGGDRSMCQSAPPFELSATPAGGQWSARGMYYGYDAYKSLYDPLLTEGNTDRIVYEAPNGCKTEVTYTFTPLDPGTDDGSCSTTLPFRVSGGQPAGGRWSGPNIDAAGIFTPPADTGSWRVTYTHPNGCSGTKAIHVAPLSAIKLDTFCESEPRVELQINPRGGVWSGDGIIFGSRAWFSPGQAGPGPHTLSYLNEFCGEVDVDIFVKEIDAFTSFTACPSEGPRILPGAWRPAGGTWYGRGIVEPTVGLFDPALFGVGADTLTYHAPNGCTDRRGVAVYTTFTRPQNDTVAVCSDDAPIQLSPNSRIFQRPLTGRWSGTGVAYAADSLAYFNPTLARPGLHRVRYTANTCEADNWFQVGQSPEWRGDTVCADGGAVTLPSAVAGTLWTGNGIIDASLGVFDPALAGEGRHLLRAFAPEGCAQEAEVFVPPVADLQFTAPEPVVCFGESLLDLQLSATVTSLRTIGRSLPLPLSSATLGEGRHTVVVTAGYPGCELRDSFAVEVRPPLRLSAKPYRDTLCAGEGARLELELSGGIAEQREFQWLDEPLLALQTRTVSPTESIMYVAILRDGCSDSVRIRLPVFVHPAVRAEQVPGPKVCFTDSTFARVVPQGTGAYVIEWRTDEGRFRGATYRGRPDVYEVEVRDTLTGCAEILDVRLPGWPPVVASMSLAPNDCISPSRGFVTLLDRSRGATSGKYVLPQGEEIAYVEGVNLELPVRDTGTFTIRLLLENEGGCHARDSVELCVREPIAFWLPTAFTPDGDGLNDVFRPTGQGIYNLLYLVVDRWGKILFEGRDLANGWNGSFNGTPCVAGTYTIRARYADAGGRSYERQGVVMLIR